MVLGKSKIELICKGGKKIDLTKSEGTILPCKVGDVFFCLNNICHDCYFASKKVE
jgi:hypothetical protein